MTALNKQALTAESARESGNILLIVAARMARRELFTPLHFVSELPQKVVSMRVFREALERSEETLQREVCKIVDGHDCMAKKLKEAETKLEAAEKRIAELEAREAKPVMFIDGDISPADADKLASVIREFNEETETPAARMARIIRENPHPTNMCDMPAAGIGVKGE